MSQQSITSILLGVRGKDLSADANSSHEFYKHVARHFDTWADVPSRDVYTMSRYIFSNLHEDDRRQWAERITRADLLESVEIAGMGGKPSTSAQKAQFVLGLIPPACRSLVPSDRLAALEEAAVEALEIKSQPATRARTL